MYHCQICDRYIKNKTQHLKTKMHGGALSRFQEYQMKNEAAKSKAKQKAMTQSLKTTRQKIQKQNEQRELKEKEEQQRKQQQEEDDKNDNAILGNLDSNFDRSKVDNIKNTRLRSRLQHEGNLVEYNKFVDELNKPRIDDVVKSALDLGIKSIPKIGDAVDALGISVNDDANAKTKEYFNKQRDELYKQIEGGSLKKKKDKNCDCGCNGKKCIKGAGLFDLFIKNGYSTKAAKLIKEYGDWRIAKINVYRKPIDSVLDKVLNFISFGGWQKGLQESQYDKMFHLGLFCVINNERGVFKNMLIEKNATIEISLSTFNIGQFGEIMPVFLDKKLTVSQLLQNGSNDLKENFFLYDPFNGATGSKGTNCQGFALGLLRGSNLLNDNIVKFILQPVETILKNIGSHVPKIARAVTDLGAMTENVKDKVKSFFGGGLGAIPDDKKLYNKVKKEADKIYKKHSAYKSGYIVKTYKSLGGTYTDIKNAPKIKPLKRWFKEDWKDVNPDKSENSYPVYRPTKRVNNDTPKTVSEIPLSRLKEQSKLKQKIKGDKNLPKF